MRRCNWKTIKLLHLNRNDYRAARWWKNMWMCFPVVLFCCHSILHFAIMRRCIKSDQRTQSLPVKDLWAGSSTSEGHKGPDQPRQPQELKQWFSPWGNQQVTDLSREHEHVKLKNKQYILKINIQSMRPVLVKSPLFIPVTTVLCLSLWGHVIWSTHIFSCFEIQYLSHSLCQNWPGGHHGDLCFLETSCEDPHVWRLHQYAETARCVNTRSRGFDV